MQAFSAASSRFAVEAEQEYAALREAARQAGRDPDDVSYSDWKYTAVAEVVMKFAYVW